MSDIFTTFDTLDPARAQALHATLGHEGPAPSELPMFWHHIYFWDAQTPDQLGRDGHPKLGGLIPDMGLPRRMWAGGDVTLHKNLRLGVQAEKRSFVKKAEHKSGRTGDLALITLVHEIWQNGDLAITEEQSLIYREEATVNAPKTTPPMAPTTHTRSQVHTFNSTTLFRYSALTFNGHRIHYDRAYAKDTEGYAGLVVHGPLLAQLLVHFAQDALGPLTTFTFRATAPLFDFEDATLCSEPLGKGLRLWVSGPDGRQCMSATANA